MIAVVVLMKLAGVQACAKCEEGGGSRRGTPESKLYHFQ